MTSAASICGPAEVLLALKRCTKLAVFCYSKTMSSDMNPLDLGSFNDL